MRFWLIAVALSLSLAATARPPGHRYTGKKITIDLQNADIGNVLRLIGDVSGKNIVFGDDIKGKVTIKLADVPWDQALEVILRTKGFGSQRDGDIIFIAPQAALDAAEERALDLAARRERSGPLVTRLIPCNYTPAREMADKVKALLSPRGTVTVDERTNTLVVRDVRSSAAVR